VNSFAWVYNIMEAKGWGGFGVRLRWVGISDYWVGVFLRTAWRLCRDIIDFYAHSLHFLCYGLSYVVPLDIPFLHCIAMSLYPRRLSDVDMPTSDCLQQSSE